MGKKKLTNLERERRKLVGETKRQTDRQIDRQTESRNSRNDFFSRCRKNETEGEL